MTSGKMPPNPSELLGSNKMKELIESLEEWADWVILDAPPLLAVADPSAVARWVDGVLMVTKAGSSTRETATKGRELLEMVGARILGSVVWGLSQDEQGGGYGYYGGHYGPYSYAGYYQDVPTDRTRKGGRLPDSGARSTVDVGAPARYTSAARIPAEGAAQRYARILGQILSVILAVTLLFAVLVVAMYFVDQSLDLGIVEQVRALLR